MIGIEEAIARVAAAQRAHAARSNWTSWASAVERVAEVTRRTGDTAARELRAAIAKVRPMSAEISWDPFSLFELQSSETSWTRWIAAILDPAHGADLSRWSWRTLCDAATAAAARQKRPAESAARWQAAREAAPGVGGVRAEDAYLEVGSIDLVAVTPKFVLVLENKLWEDWHDSAKGRQANRYRKAAEILSLKHARPAVLVLLSARTDLRYVDGLSPGPCEVPFDYLWISYREWAQSMRRSLPASRTSIELWPAFLTLAAIERHILGLTIREGEVGMRDLAGLAEFAAYLEIGMETP
jgi:hypothetical protein